MKRGEAQEKASLLHHRPRRPHCSAILMGFFITDSLKPVRRAMFYYFPKYFQPDTTFYHHHPALFMSMANPGLDVAQLSESQQLALGTYTSVTNQEPSAAIPLLQRSEWNVQVCLLPPLTTHTVLIGHLDSYCKVLRWRSSRSRRRGTSGLACLASCCLIT